MRKGRPIGTVVEGAHGDKWKLLCTLQKRRQDRRTPNLLQFADPNIAVAHWMIVVLQRKRKLFRASRVRRAHRMPGRTGRLDGMLILCYIVSVGTCVQKRETPPAFFILGIPSSASARIFRGTTPPYLPDHPHRTEVMRPCLPAGAGAA